jgi:hypothetical protein
MHLVDTDPLPRLYLYLVQVHEIARQQGKDVAAAYAARHAERRFKQVGGG